MFLFAMAGASSRFRRVGFNVPKYELVAHGHTLFEHSVIGFRHYFSSHRFIFVGLRENAPRKFVERCIARLGLQASNISVVELEGLTAGQAETVALALDELSDCESDSLSIFNIDTFRPGFRFPRFLEDGSVDGYLETFSAAGEQWSFVRPVEGDQRGRVAEVAEKRRISSLCSTGFYYFRSAQMFREAYGQSRMVGAAALEGGERYVAPLFNYLIRAGRDVRYHHVSADEVIQCGTPEEYDRVLKGDAVLSLWEK